MLAKDLLTGDVHRFENMFPPIRPKTTPQCLRMFGGIHTCATSASAAPSPTQTHTNTVGNNHNLHANVRARVLLHAQHHQQRISHGNSGHCTNYYIVVVVQCWHAVCTQFAHNVKCYEHTLVCFVCALVIKHREYVRCHRNRIPTRWKRSQPLWLPVRCRWLAGCRRY